jgi:signal transduction histidine kinase
MSQEVLGNSKETVPMPATELRVSLQSILGFTQLLQLTGDNLKPIQLRYLASIESAAAQLLAHASTDRIRPGRLVFERVVIDLDEAVAAAVERVRSLSDAKSVRLQPDRSGLSILGDREQTEQMLLNLLGCAIRSTPAEGTVRIRAHRLGEGIQLTIADTGIGIPRELTAAKRLAEMMGGELEWIQEADDRTGINVRLPAPPAGA